MGSSTETAAHTKNILVVFYSQTGQLQKLTEQFAAPLKQHSDICVETLEIKPRQAFAFPWRFMKFFNTFPETVHLQPQAIEPLKFQRERYDLVVIAYSVWFLSPAQPVTAFMQSREAQAVLNNTPVVTLIGCRNMWLMAQEKMKKLLQHAGARLVGNVVKTDQCGSAASFITTPAWMLTGNKKPVSWLPSAGISDEEIADAARFGQKIADTLQADKPLDETLLQNMGAVKINEKLILSERFAHRSFYLWGKLLIAAGKISPLLRKGILCFYIVFLVAVILTVVPVTALLKSLFAPLLKNKIQMQKQQYGWPSGE
ncbi:MULTISPECIES: dialkylrecorsinol condensing enzyme [unclassified Neisseria]|uniref:flavodoxin family protein n=1 Tax=unclassified Neisseria TaxID=2623750 RepID=UPI002666799A|nr:MULTISPECIES: dialkylrecorsinol condensing enzyme [unclassified Neisseria]MDO1508871.1 dialkylresorcinol condensing enzyme [Neisseria sp. MVDL19-042950]MDO1515130.1 dialkylresorcinol condensing enzyme [Neisseria sp. MVDL18-041461]MDO1562490.1 dialkylresorcinol condensing enzyme [Neisseria sp. MVDL20-010259]